MGKKNKVMEIRKSHGISLLLITNHAREVPIIPYLQAYWSDLAKYCSSLSVYVLDFQCVMLGGRQTIFLTPYFQFGKKFDFLHYFLCLPSWHHGKRLKLSWKVMEKSWNFIIGFLWEPCGCFLLHSFSFCFYDASPVCVTYDACSCL